MSEQARACAAAAANPFETGIMGLGRDQLDVVADVAIPACELAVEREPDNIRALAWLARALYLHGQYDAMIPHLELAAAAGSPVAQQILGDALVEGRGIERDFERSFALLEASAAQNYAPGIYSLGLSYQYGEGVEQDLEMAASLFRQAAAQGHRFAMADLGLMLIEGTGVPVDVAEGKALLEHAASLRDGWAMLQLGHLHLDSGLVEPNPQRALGYFLAADDLDTEEAAGHAALLLLGEYPDVPANYPQALRLAQESAERDEGVGFYVLGRMARDGLGMTSDHNLARQHFERGAQLEDERAQAALDALREP